MDATDLHRIADRLEAEAAAAQGRAQDVRDLAARLHDLPPDVLDRDRVTTIALLVGGVSQHGYATVTLFGREAVDALMALGGTLRRHEKVSDGGTRIVAAWLDVGSVHFTAQYDEPVEQAAAEADEALADIRRCAGATP